MSDYVYDAITKRAYEIWQETGNTDQFRNWVQAEYELGLQFSDQELARYAHSLRLSDKGSTKSDEYYWFQALNKLRSGRCHPPLSEKEKAELTSRDAQWNHDYYHCKRASDVQCHCEDCSEY